MDCDCNSARVAYSNGQFMQTLRNNCNSPETVKGIGWRLETIDITHPLWKISGYATALTDRSRRQMLFIIKLGWMRTEEPAKQEIVYKRF